MASKRSSRDARRRSRADRNTSRPPAGRRWLLLSLAVVLIVAILAYRPALRGPFIFDDYHLPFTDPDAAKAGAAFWIGGVRPVLMATYWINFIISGTSTFSYHAGNLFLHAVTAVIVFFLLRRVLDLAEVTSNRESLAFFGAGLFLLHPLQTESVAYIAGRSEVVAGLFFALAWAVFLNNLGSATTVPTAIEILLLGGVAVASKESAIVLPAVLFLTDMYWNPAGVKQLIRRRLTLYVPLVLGGLLAAAKIMHSLTADTAAGFAVRGATPGLYVLTQCRVILIYVRLFLLPVGQNGDWALSFFGSLADTGAWAWVLGIMALVAIIVWSYHRAKLFSFGLLMFLVLLLPTSSIVPIRDAIAERRMYLPIVGLILASMWAMDNFRSRSPILREPGAQRIVMVSILAVAAALSFERSKVWSSDVLFWADSARANPSNSRAHMGLGAAYILQGRCMEAIGEFQTVVREAGDSVEAVNNLATAYECNHQLKLALDQLHTLVAKHPSVGAYDRIGYIEGKAGHLYPALDALDRALSLDPNDVKAHTYRGYVKSMLGDSSGAQADLRRALELEPGNDAASKGLAAMALQK